MRGTSVESLWAAHAGGCPRGRGTQTAVIMSAVALLAAIGVAGCSGHGSTSAPGGSSGSLSWSAARAPLPAAASGQYAQLVDVSCPDVGDCVAVGGDEASGAGGDASQGLAETLSDGTWTPTLLPGVSSKNYAMLVAVSCPARGTCVAVGYTNAAANAYAPVIETLSGGRWVSVKPPLPADADTTGQAALDDVACPAAGTCVATGWYNIHGDLGDAYVDSLANGTWTAASVPLPPDAAQQQFTSNPSTNVNAVACPQPGICVATGQYQDHSGQTVPLIATLSGGSWTTARAPLPADAAAAVRWPGALFTLGCPAPGACIAAGLYFVGSGQPRYLTETQSGGTWTAAALPLPADAAADQQWSKYESTGISWLTCESAGTCVALASYVNKANEPLSLIETLSGKTWTAARPPLPAGATPSTIYLSKVSCPAAGHCVAVGQYTVADGTHEVLIETSVPR